MPASNLPGTSVGQVVLSGLGCPEDKIEAVRHAIAAHRASVGVERRSAEALCLANADALAHIEQVPSLLHLVYARWGRGIGSAWRSWPGSSVFRFRGRGKSVSRRERKESR